MNNKTLALALVIVMGAIVFIQGNATEGYQTSNSTGSMYSNPAQAQSDNATASNATASNITAGYNMSK